MSDLIEPKTVPTKTKKTRSVARNIFTGLGVILFLMGAAIIYMTLFQEQKATALYGDIKVKAATVIRENGGTPPGEEPTTNGLPTIRLEGEGGQRELDWCTGAFVHMLGYQDKNNLPPVWSAHNNCGGYIILDWSIGTRFMVGDQEYEVIDFKTAPQRGSTTDDIAGIQGDFVLQSCSYNGYTMFFMGAKKVKSEAEIKAEQEAAKKKAEAEAKKKLEPQNDKQETPKEEAPVEEETTPEEPQSPSLSS